MIGVGVAGVGVGVGFGVIDVLSVWSVSVSLIGMIVVGVTNVVGVVGVFGVGVVDVVGVGLTGLIGVGVMFVVVVFVGVDVGGGVAVVGVCVGVVGVGVVSVGVIGVCTFKRDYKKSLCAASVESFLQFAFEESERDKESVAVAFAAESAARWAAASGTRNCVVQAQSQQISELVQLVKNLGEMQAASLARGAVSASAGAATGAETVGDPMEVDKDTGGVRHNKAENYLPKIPMLSHEKMGTRASEIANWAEKFAAWSKLWLRVVPEAQLGVWDPVEVFDSHLRLISYEKESTHAKSFWNEDTLAAFNKGKGKKGKDSKGKPFFPLFPFLSFPFPFLKEKEGKGKGGDSKGAASKVKCFNWDEVGHFARDCPHPKKEKGAGASGQPKANRSGVGW
eukprot:s6687_g1.t1